MGVIRKKTITLIAGITKYCLADITLVFGKILQFNIL